MGYFPQYGLKGPPPSVRRRDMEIDARARAAPYRRAARKANQGCLFGLALLPLWMMGAAAKSVRRRRCGRDDLSV